MTLVKRSEWAARSPKHVSRGDLNAKSTGHWNGPKVTIAGKTTWDHSKCASLVRGIQNFHMDSRGWSDIAYNFVICPHGYIYEGRGCNVINGANGTNRGNRTSHAVMWLAGEGNPFLDDEKTAFKDAVKHVSTLTNAPNDAIGHRDHKSTECPGDERYSWIHAGMPTNHKPPAKKVLKLGDTGDAVGWLQAGLNIVAKYRKPASGKGIGAQIPIKKPPVFDTMTQEAVREFQRFLVDMWALSGKKSPRPEVNGYADETVANGIAYFGKTVN